MIQTTLSEDKKSITISGNKEEIDYIVRLGLITHSEKQIIHASCQLI